MKVLVVGGTGLIGSHAVHELSARGHQVRVLSRNPPQGITLPEGIELARGDYLIGGFEEAFDGVEGIVHAAGTDYRILPKGSAWEFFRRTNVEASARLFADAQRAGVRRGVFVTSFYHAIRPDYVSHPYIRSRQESETAALEACRDRLGLSIVQPSWVMGPTAGHVNLGEVFARWAYSLVPLSITPGGTNWIAATSLGHAIATALEKGEAGARYLVGDENLTWAEVLGKFVAALGLRRKVRGLPRFTALASGSLTALTFKLIGRESGLEPRGWTRAFMEEAYFDASPAQAALGYPAGVIDRAIEETAAFWKERLGKT